MTKPEEAVFKTIAHKTDLHHALEQIKETQSKLGETPIDMQGLAQRISVLERTVLGIGEWTLALVKIHQPNHELPMEFYKYGAWDVRKCASCGLLCEQEPLEDGELRCSQCGWTRREI